MQMSPNNSVEKDSRNLSHVYAGRERAWIGVAEAQQITLLGNAQLIKSVWNSCRLGEIVGV